MELRELDWLSSGRRAMVERSISECMAESFSTRSEPPSTVTVVELLWMASWTGGVTCTAALRSMWRPPSVKPGAVILSW